MGVTCTADAFRHGREQCPLAYRRSSLRRKMPDAQLTPRPWLPSDCRDECHFAYGILVARLVQEVLVKGSNAIVKSKLFADYPEHGINAAKGLECLLAKTG